MYKQLKTDLEDKRILEEEILGKKERIKYIIQKELGVHATTYSELKVQCPVIDTKNARVFGKLEKLDKELHTIEGEYNIIDKSLENIDEIISTMDSIEKQVFRCRYILGLSRKATAERLNYSPDRIKQITKKILQR